MVGALVGGAFGHGVHTLFPVHTAGSGAYALVGMGAIVAGTTHAPITAIMMIFEQTNSYQIVLPLMFVCVVSHFTARLLGGRSLHEAGLARQGVTLPRGPEESVMQTMRVSSVMHEEVQAVNHSLPFVTVVERFLNEPYNNLYVVDSTGRFLGAIRLHALKNMLHQTDALTSVIADDLLDDSFQFVTRDQNLAEVMQVFWHERASGYRWWTIPLTGYLSVGFPSAIYLASIARKCCASGNCWAISSSTPNTGSATCLSNCRLGSSCAQSSCRPIMMDALWLNCHCDPITGYMSSPSDIAIL